MEFKDREFHHRVTIDEKKKKAPIFDPDTYMKGYNASPSPPFFAEWMNDVDNALHS